MIELNESFSNERIRMYKSVSKNTKAFEKGDEIRKGQQCKIVHKIDRVRKTYLYFDLRTSNLPVL